VRIAESGDGGVGRIVDESIEEGRARVMQDRGEAVAVRALRGIVWTPIAAAILVLAGLLVAACGGGGLPGAGGTAPAPGGSVAPEAQPGAPGETTGPAAWTAPPLSPEQLGNLAFPGVFEGAAPVTLQDGTYDGPPFTPGGSARPEVRLVPELVASGDLDGDTRPDAVVLLTASTGGSATRVELAAVLGEPDGPRALPVADLGDRVQVRGLTIEGREAVLDAVVAAPDDALCCPSQLVRERWQVQDDTLHSTGSEALGPLSVAALDGTGWRLVAFGPGRPVPSGMEVTARFSDGRVGGSAGCNAYTAGVTGGAEPWALSLSPVATTRKLCPEPVMDLERRYLSLLRGTRSFGYAFGRLVLSRGSQGGRWGALLFAPVPEPEPEPPAPGTPAPPG
jgi:heat shock protein HslJ